jgi:hypothetical protein
MSMMSDKASRRQKSSIAEPIEAVRPVEPAAPTVAIVEPVIVVKSVETPDPLAGVAITAEEFRPSVVEGLEVTIQQSFPPDPDDIKTPVLAVPRLRVIADGKVLLGACMHRFRAGNVLDPTHYDAHTFEQITRALKVEQITD